MKFISLTLLNNDKVLVNSQNISYIQEHPSSTDIVFDGSNKIKVKEKTEEILILIKKESNSPS